jgi:hypothetical protein
MFTGCAEKAPKPDVRVLHYNEGKQGKETPPPDTIPPKLSITPIIGSQQDDAKVVRDFGVVLKMWVAPYEDTNGNLIASHDVYVVARPPRWIGAETLPQKASGLRNPSGKLPFVVRPETVDASSDFANEEIKTFLNERAVIEDKNALPAPTNEALDKYDETILDFVKTSRRNGVIPSDQNATKGNR